MQLWRVRSLATFRGIRWAAEYRESMENMVRQEREAVRLAYGADPDLDLFATLFSPNLPHTSVPDNPDELGVHRILVEGVVVRYVDRMHSMKVVVEGPLPDEVSAALVEDLRRKLALLEHTEYVVSEL